MFDKKKLKRTVFIQNRYSVTIYTIPKFGVSEKRDFIQ